MAGDLRAWLQQAAEIGKLKRISNLDWHLEIGAASAINQRTVDCPALLFGDIPGYPPDYRVLTCTGATPKLVALTLGLAPIASDLELLHELLGKWPEWEAKLDQFCPEVTRSGPILQNVATGRDVNLFRFPVPKWFPHDGGRYIGTGHAVITMDPDTGDVNMGTYRLQALDEKTAGWFTFPGQHGERQRRKYHDSGVRCPVAVSLGHHPLVFRISSIEVPYGAEFKFLGAIQGEPVKVITEELTGLPIPADSEIVLAGWSPPGVYRTEGPFGEFTGYYGRAAACPVIEVERIYYRDNPIMIGSIHERPHRSYFWNLFHSLMLQRELVNAGVQGVRGVWLGTAAGPAVAVVSLEQRDPAHAMRAARVLSQCNIFDTQVKGKFVVVVDDDIDPTNMDEVLWAMGTRSVPAEGVHLLTSTPGRVLDSMLAWDAHTSNDKVVILACKPYSGSRESPRAVEIAPETLEKLRLKLANQDRTYDSA